MPDGFREFEAVLGALSKMSTDETPSEDLVGARCPKCEASDFVKITDLYDEARRRVEDAEPADPALSGGMTDAQIVARFAPPQRKSANLRIAIAAVVLGGAAYAVYHWFGELPGELAAAGAVVLLAPVALTSIRKFSDDYYNRRARWRKLYMCRKCGQLIAP